VGSMKAEFSLAPNLIVVRESHSSMFGAFKSSKDIIREVPPSITAEDIQQVLDFFFIVMVERSSEVLNIEVPPVPAAFTLLSMPPTDDTSAPPAVPPVGPLATASAVVTTVTSWWTSIAKAFKTTKSTQIVGRIQQQGFNKFSGSSMLDHVEDLEDAYLSSYLDILLGQINIPSDKLNDLKGRLMLATHLSAEHFLLYDITFNINNGGDCKYVCLAITHDMEKKTTSIMVADIQATFALAPNILIVQKTQSKLGGIYESSSQSIEYQNRPIQTTDIQAVFQFFQVVAFDQFAKLLNVPAAVPTDVSTPSLAASRFLRGVDVIAEHSQ